MLTAAHTRVDTLGGRIRIVCSNANLRKVFEITGLDKVFAIHSTRSEIGQTRTAA